MTETIISILIIFTIIISNVVIAVLFERWLVKKGYIRDNINMIETLLFPIGIVVVKLIWYTNTSWWYFLPLMILGETIGVNRADLWTTMKRGKWWWNSPKNERDG